MYLTHADLSAWNDAGEFDWQAYKDAGHEAIAFRITSGLYVDPFTQREWNRAGDVGLLRLGYHFFYPSVSIHNQANLFMDSFPSEPELGAWADVEVGFSSATVSKSTDPGQPMQAGEVPSVYRQWLDRLSDGLAIASTSASIDPQLRTFLELVDQMNLYNKTGVYSSKYRFEKYVGRNISYYNNRPLWTAHWNQFVSNPLIPDSFLGWVFWQVDNSTAFPGIPDRTCDLNRFGGTLEDLKEWAGIGEEPTLEQKVDILWAMKHTHE